MNSASELSTDIDCTELLNEMGLKVSDSNSENEKKISKKMENKTEKVEVNAPKNINDHHNSLQSDQNNFEIYSASQDLSSDRVSKETEPKSNPKSNNIISTAVMDDTASEIEDIPSSGSFKQSTISINNTSNKNPTINKNNIQASKTNSAFELTPENSETNNEAIPKQENTEDDPFVDVNSDMDNIFPKNDSNKTELQNQKSEKSKSQNGNKQPKPKGNKKANNKQQKKKNNRNQTPVIDLSDLIDNPPKQNETTHIEYNLDFLNFPKKNDIDNQSTMNITLENNEISAINSKPNETGIHQQPHSVVSPTIITDGMTETALEQRITDYFNLSLRKLVSDFTNELSGLLDNYDTSNAIFKKFTSDLRQSVENAIHFSPENASSTFLSNSNNSGLLSSFSINNLPFCQSSGLFENNAVVSEIIDPYAKEFNSILRTVEKTNLVNNPPNQISNLRSYISELHLKSNSMTNQFPTLLKEMHQMVEKSSQNIQRRISKIKSQKNNRELYEKLYDLEKRELEFRIQNQLFEQQKQQLDDLNRSYQQFSFIEDDFISKKMRIISSFPSKEKVIAKVTSFIDFITENKDRVLRQNRRRAKMNSREFLDKLEQSKDESRSLRQSIRLKTQEFCSGMSLISMENQAQKEKQLSSTLSMMASRQIMNRQNNSLTMAPIYSNQKNQQENASLVNPNNNDSFFENQQMINNTHMAIAEMDMKMKKDIEETKDFIASLNRRQKRRKEHSHHHRHKHSIITPSRGTPHPNLNISSELDLSDNDENLQANRRNEKSIKASHKTVKYQNERKLKTKSSYV